ncbi:sodium:solute symporter [Betaproteobacteria bacterium]|nr:sodium:solute symporter [Betaproteobacteria bacterium]GHU03960.1 sodium:solute symporter [Betaproteobacteria bacterium]GHU19194.1 sodium:solute symporter [Betaproteobacteria bacterium]
MLAKILMMAVFFVVTLYIGFHTRKRARDVDGFVLGGRRMGSWLSAFAYGTSYFSAVVFIGYAGQFGWKYGMAALWIGLGNAFVGSLLAWYVLGARTRAMTHHLHAQTMPEFFGARYASPALRIAAALIIFVFLIPYTAGVYSGLSRLFDMAFDVPYEWCIIGMAVLTCIYVVMGGYVATAVNDMVQGVIMLFGIVAVIVSVLSGYGGFTQAVVTLSQVPSDVPGMETMQGAFTSIFGPDLSNLVGVLILTSLGVWGMPQMVQKFYAIKSSDAIKRGAIISTVFALVVAGGSYFLGGFSRLASAQVALSTAGTPVYDSVIPSMLANMPDLLIGLTVVLVLSASMSTLSSLVLTSSSTLTLDVLKGRFIQERDIRLQLLAIRLLLVAFVLISTVIAIVQYNSAITFIAQLMGISWGVLAGAFLAPFLYGLYWQRTTTGSVWACFIFALALICSNMVWGYMSPINAGALTMLAGLVIVPVVSLFTPRPDADTVRVLFKESYLNLHDNKIDAD